MEFKKRYDGYLSRFEEALERHCDGFSEQSPKLKEAMKYSVMLGGKRVRPVSLLATAEILGVKTEDAMPFAVAIELIHTYSLIHDDLPAMDNDDYRRGKPSNHKVFGEAHAVLAGDALLNNAYELCIKQCFKGEKFIQAAAFLCESAGEKGMIAGQSADILCSGKDITETELEFIYANKTGKLLVAPFMIPSILADYRYYTSLKEFSTALGELFQLTDDILDVTGSLDTLGKTAGKDEAEDKATCVKLYGLEKSRLKAEMCADTCLYALERMDTETDFLKELVYYVRDRKN
jgi:geranylgeranyl diphosphate synthase type II